MNGVSLRYETVTGWTGRKGSATQFNKAQYYWTMGKCLEIEDVIKKHINIMDEYDPNKHVGLLVDEWGTWWDEEPGTIKGHLYQQNSMRDAFVAALTLNVFHKHTDRIKMANIAQIVNVLQSMILTNNKGGMVLTPTYHVFEMYKGFQNATYLPLDITCDSIKADEKRNIPVISSSAALKKDGAIIISLANIDTDNAQTVEIQLDGKKTKILAGRILTCNAITDYNDFDQPAKVKPAIFKGAKIKQDEIQVKIPAKSIVVIEAE